MIDNGDKSQFATRIAKVLERVEYRRADSQEEKDAIFRMRYEAYSREGYIEKNSTGLFSDADDERVNTWLMAVYIDGALASSIRLHVASQPDQFLPISKGFPEVMAPMLAQGQVVIDASRQTSRLEFTRAYPFLPLITMRCGYVGMLHFDADVITGVCRAEYQQAFRRMFGSTTRAGPRPYPPLTRPHVLMAYDCKKQWPDTVARYPFLASDAQEQRSLFGRSSTVDRDLQAELTSGRRAPLSGDKHSSTTYAA